MSRKLFTKEQKQLLRQPPLIFTALLKQGSLSLRNSKKFLWLSIKLVNPLEKSLKIKSTESSIKTIDPVVQQTLIQFPLIPPQFLRLMKSGSSVMSRLPETGNGISKKNFLNQNYKEVGALLMNDSSCIFEIIYNTLLQSHNTMSVKTLCEMAGVSRSGYYVWLKAAPSRALREQQDRDDFELILAAFKMHGYSKGTKGIYMALLHMTPSVVMNLKKIRRLMDKFNLSCPYRKANPYRRMAKALKTSYVADNLLQREFEAYGPRIVLLTDITYLSYNGTFAYLSTVLDAFTKQILSYVLSPSLEVDFVLETINKLVEDHGVSLQSETIIHSDQGCHYTSRKFINILYDKKLRQSMSRKGNCWDNAPQESFFGHMKDHIKPKLAEYTTFDDVQVIVDDYIHYYNHQRYLWHLAKLSPDEFYKFATTGEYPLDIPNVPAPPAIPKDSKLLGKAAVYIDFKK